MQSMSRSPTPHSNFDTQGTWLAFGAAVIYAGIAAFQWSEMHKATVISREGVEAVQRAFVSFNHFEWVRAQGRGPSQRSYVEWHSNV